MHGAAPLLVPYLAEAGHICPTTHNPADFVLETLLGDIEAPAQLSELCQNGKLCRKLDRITAKGGRKPVLHSDESIQRIFVEHVAKEQMQKMEFPTTFLTQFLILSKRMFLQTSRNSLLEWNRFVLFSISGILTAVCSEGLGLAVGSAFSVTNGSIIGPAIAAPLLALCCYGMGFGPYIETSMKFLMSASYLRYGLSGFSLALYENRANMECKAEFCLYSNPKLILRDVGMTNDSYIIQVVGLLIFTFIHRLVAYFALRYRLTNEFSNKFMTYVSKFLKHR
ncbi:unnamed protein product [Diatraea saccharalis]|uniref:Uncharacterized protein n=1 Tax=Diatraea saccharalis TaxID=40085 RepID=A0A9N9QXY0_9NEOP|nr:unnamed protein product [Diatraea saccharalis]